MSKAIFFGGSRSIKRLRFDVKKAIDECLLERDTAIVGDADGADTEIQRHFLDIQSNPSMRNFAFQVKVYYSGDKPRNYLNGNGWKAVRVEVPPLALPFCPVHLKGHLVKDAHMASIASHAFMVWDGASVGTLHNVQRALDFGGKALLWESSDSRPSRCRDDWDNTDSVRFNYHEDWENFLQGLPVKLVDKLKERIDFEKDK